MTAATIYDAIIVGGGPAGSAAAWQLSRLGRSVLLLEKERFPRYKPCGGGVSAQVAGWFDFPLESQVLAKVRRFRFTWKGGNPIQSELDPAQAMWLVRRESFDAYLLEQARGRGASVETGREVLLVEKTSSGWKVQVPGQSFACRWLIAADGGRGQTAKKVGFFDRKFALAGAIEAEIPAANPDPEVVLDFGRVHYGYAWSFPKPDGYSIGIGSYRGAEEGNLVKILQEFCADLKLNLHDGRWYGHPILLWNGEQPLHGDHTLLAGEAACCVDPFTSEGIRWALWTGLRAGEATHQALQGDGGAPAEYSRRVQTEFGKEMDWAAKLAGAFFKAPWLGYKVATHHPGAVRTLMRLLSGELAYSQVTEKALAKLNPLKWLGL